MTEVVDMLDAIGVNAGRIPKGTKRVAIYLTGSGGIAWTNADVAELRRNDPELQTIARIVQASNPNDVFLQVKTLVVDIEPGAASLGTALAIAKTRAAHGLRTTLYYFLDEGPQVRDGVAAAGLEPHIDYWLAHWGIGRDAAVALLGTQGIVAVQYQNGASVDYNVTVADWPAPLVPPKPAPRRSQALLTAVEEGNGARWEITGVSNKGDENIPNAEDWNVKVTKHSNGGWSATPAPATKPTKRAALSIHPKVAAVGVTGGTLTAIRAALAAFGVHVPLTDTEQAAIIAALPVVAGYLKSSGVEVTV